MILAADVGGTKTNVGFFGIQSGKLVCVAEETYQNERYKNLTQILGLFIKEEAHQATSACIGVAGPVQNGRCVVTNLPWTVDATEIRKSLAIEHVAVLNDLEATAHSLDHLEADQLLELHAGNPSVGGNRAVIAAGTGLGEAGVYWNGSEYEPFASEGGHSTFGPRNKIELALADFLIEQYGHASWERVVSGPGIVNNYRFLLKQNHRRANADIAERIENEGAAAIANAALNHTCEICEQALNLFATLYAAEAGNLALKVFATGGVYIGGGIAPQILPKLRTPEFLAAFADKGRMRALLEDIPIRVITTNRAAMIGAAAYARRLSAGNANLASLDDLNVDYSVGRTNLGTLASGN